MTSPFSIFHDNAARFVSNYNSSIKHKADDCGFVSLDFFNHVWVKDASGVIEMLNSWSVVQATTLQEYMKRVKCGTTRDIIYAYLCHRYVLAKAYIMKKKNNVVGFALVSFSIYADNSSLGSINFRPYPQLTMSAMMTNKCFGLKNHWSWHFNKKIVFKLFLLNIIFIVTRKIFRSIYFHSSYIIVTFVK